MSDKKKITELLKEDPLVKAEKITGLSSQNSTVTAFLGMAFASDLADKKHNALMQSGDSTGGDDVNDYIKIIESIGFKEILKFSYATHSYAEHLFVYWNCEHSVMIEFETYQSSIINSATMHYNWRPNIADQYYPYTGSGQPIDGVYVGYNDVREGVKHQFNNFVENGEFVKKWIKIPQQLWLLTRMDYKKGISSFDYQKSIDRKLAGFPKDVLTCVSPDAIT